SEEKEAEEDDFSEEEADLAEPRTKLGDVWLLGEHRLMCGDSTDAESVARLMDDEKADMVFTDPPYGVEAVSTSNQVGGGGELKFKGKIGGDKPFGHTDGKVVKANKYMPIKGD